MSFLLETIRLGLNNLRLRALRSVLTALGIILGVGAVITMVSIGEGSKRAALEQIERLGANNVIIRSVKPPEAAQAQSGNRRGFSLRYGLTRDDLKVIKQGAPGRIIVPLKAVGGEVSREAMRQTSQAFGTTPDLLRVARLTVARGRYITSEDMDQRAAVAVIGHELAKALFPFDDPLGNSIRIDRQTFTVVGVLTPVGLAGGAAATLVGRDFNFDLHLPITTAEARFGDLVVRRGGGSFQAENVQVSEIYYEAEGRDTVMLDSAILKRTIEVRHPRMTDVQMIVPFELLENARRTQMTWNFVLGSIAGISLLVGGIGIMNIMLASVTERTREIGIRRALGATRRHIIWQFLVETGVLSVIGGLLGVALGVGASFALEAVLPILQRLDLVASSGSRPDIQTQVTSWSILLSFAVALFTGLVFGIYPAIVAARQDPIVALRHD